MTIAIDERMTKISQGMLDRFDREGFLILKGLFDPNEVVELRSAMMELMQRLGFSDRSSDTGFDPLRREEGQGDAINPNRLVFLDDLHTRHPRLDAHMRSQKLADVFCPLWDADIKSFQAASVIKPPQDNNEWRGWHQDMPDYVPLSNDRNACAITYLFEMGPNSGGTSLVPGSHRWGLKERTYETVHGWPERLKRRSMEGFDPEEHDILAPSFNPGDVFVFHSSLYHKANNNMTDVSKVGLINVYQAEDCMDVSSRNKLKAANLPITKGRRVDGQSGESR